MKHSGIKQAASEAIESERDSLIALSRYINENPETAYKEKKASAALVGYLEARGFRITTPAGGLETAFIADCFHTEETSGSGRRDTAEEHITPVAFIAEYDALEGIGHGCGHNLIAAAAAAAATGTAAALKAFRRTAENEYLPKFNGPVFKVIGTPAEEVLTETAGKNRLIEAGVFNNIGNCLMFHPWIRTGVAVKDLGGKAFRIEFSGKAAHAAADPWNGHNALDAAVMFYNSVSMMRQQLPKGLKLHCIIPEGGKLLNIIPESAATEVMLRSTEVEDLETGENMIRDCAAASAACAGCSHNLVSMAAVKPILFNPKLFELAAANMNAAGETLERLPVWEASSDFGDVSRMIPSLSLLYKTHDEQTCWHSRAAADTANSAEAADAMFRAARILAATAIDLIFEKN